MPPSPSAIDVLQTSLDRWDYVDYFFCALVFLGVMGEFLAEFTNCFNVKKKKYRKRKLGQISTIVLMLGLAGELVCLFKTSALSGQIIASLKSQANNARADAAKANENITLANERVANAEKETARLNLKAEEEHLARTKIEEKMAPRILTAKQIKDVVSQIQKYSGQKVNICALAGDPEIGNLAVQIDNLFSQSHWVSAVQYVSSPSPGSSGVVVEYNNVTDVDTLMAATDLVSALSAAGLQVTGPAQMGPQSARLTSGGEITDAKIQVTVGKK